MLLILALALPHALAGQDQVGTWWASGALGYGSYGDFCDGDEGECPEREDAFTVALGAGWVLERHLLLGFTLEAVLLESVAAFGLEASSNVTAVLFGVRWYPISGLYVSAEVGAGSVEYTLSSGSGSISASERGPMGSGGIGYDIRLPTQRHVLLTPFVSARALRSSDFGWANYVHGGVGVTFRFN